MSNRKVRFCHCWYRCNALFLPVIHIRIVHNLFYNLSSFHVFVAVVLCVIKFSELPHHAIMFIFFFYLAFFLLSSLRIKRKTEFYLKNFCATAYLSFSRFFSTCNKSNNYSVNTLY